MSGIKASESLSGHISGDCKLSGSLSCIGSLYGKISASIDNNYIPYVGDYEVEPNAFNTQIIPTANKLLKQDIVVKKIPYYETSNSQDGVTVYIAGE